MAHFYDAQETRSPAEREAALLAALPGQVAHAKSASALTRPTPSSKQVMEEKGVPWRHTKGSFTPSGKGLSK